MRVSRAIRFLTPIWHIWHLRKKTELERCANSLKLWGGRFGKETDELVNELNQSISFDQRLYQEDIQGSLAHAAMLAECGIIPKKDAAAIAKGLHEILEAVEDGEVEFTAENEDIHMNVEALLTARTGDAGKRLHTARSRNDQVALDFRMYVRKEISVICGHLLEMESVLCRQARKYQNAVMPGYTHLQRAQPISFAQHLMAYAQMFSRDVTRLEDCGKRLNECPLGSGALAGTTYPIDRWQTAKALGFEVPMSNSLDGVSDRDYALEFLSGLSILMMHLSRFAEEVILWCSWEFKFIELDDAYATGSSIMPQKKNPDVAELVRGKTGRVYGDLMSLLTVMKGLPLAYNKDGLRRGGHRDPVPPRIRGDAGHHDRPAGEHAPGGGPRLHQRHRLRRLPDQKGDALPGCLHRRREAGCLLRRGGEDAGGAVSGRAESGVPAV